MKALLLFWLLTLSLNASATAGPIWPAKRNHPTRLVHFDVGVLVTAAGKLRVNVDKQLGGQVYIQLLDQQGRVYFDRTLYADEEAIRLNLDVSRLPTKAYRLKVSNGLEMITRDVLIADPEPAPASKTVILP